VPATDLKAARRDLSAGERAELARDLVREFGRQLALRGFEVGLDEHPPRDLELTVTVEAGRHRLRLGDRWIAFGPQLPREDLWVSSSIDDETWSHAPAEVTAVDLSVPRVRGPSGPLADAFREFLRKRGVRLRPRTWTYPGGWL
jgi:hypothetical protein